MAQGHSQRSRELSQLQRADTPGARLDLGNHRAVEASRLPQLLPAWYAFSEARALHRAVQWLAEQELIDQETADHYQASHPEPDLP